MDIKALHISDLHLDTVYPHIMNRGDIRRQEQKVVFSRILGLAIEERVDMVLIAGDLFDLSRVSPRTVDFIKDGINSIAPIPVFIAPGNSDPYIPESPYACTRWPSNTVIFTSNRFKLHEIPDKKVFLYGAANKSSEDDHGVLKNFTPRPKEGLHVLLFHGTYQNHMEHRGYACLPFSHNDLERVKAHYCALGHYHRRFSIDGLPGGLTAAYCGAADFLHYDDEREKGVLLVTLSEKEAFTRFVPTGISAFHLEHLDCTEIQSENNLVERVKELSEEKGFSGQSLRLILEGEPPLSFNMESLHQKLESLYLSFSVVDETTTLAPLPLFAAEKTILSHFWAKQHALVTQEKGEYRSSLRKAFFSGLNSLVPEKESGF